MSQLPSPETVLPNSTVRLAYVVDDEPQVRAVVCKILASIGFVSHAFGGPSALIEELKRASPEIDRPRSRARPIRCDRGHPPSRDFPMSRARWLLISGRDYVTLREIQRIGEQRGLTMAPPVQSRFVPTTSRSAWRPLSWRRRSTSHVPAKGDAKQARIDPAEALRNGWLRLWYQAKIDLKSMTVCGAEALLRVKHPELGLLDPTSCFR